MTPIAPTRVLIVGGGGREHALAWKLAAEPGVNEIVVGPGSAGIATEARVRILPLLDPSDPVAVVSAARSMAAELVVVGPEAPLAAGVADALIDAGIAVFGPTRHAARLETSKAFCHEVAAAAGVRTARARAFSVGAAAAAAAYIGELEDAGSLAVLKADGLAAGKGVIVTESADEAIGLVPRFLRGGAPGSPALVIEERLNGPEASVIAVTDGIRVIALPAARDHKRLRDGDLGPNTGGMGAYSPLPDLDDTAVGAILETVHRPILVEMARRGTPFRGFLYAGLMLTGSGPVLLECNVRLGDPEAQVILPRLAIPLGSLLLAAARGQLPEAPSVIAPTLPDTAVGIVLAALGYPGEPHRGDPIAGLDEAAATGAIVFHAGTVVRPEGGFATNGGRILTVVGRGPGLSDARELAERAADAIAWDGLQRRRDIGIQPAIPVGVAG
jgi:phosphoribosylamine---glycine ligase